MHLLSKNVAVALIQQLQPQNIWLFLSFQVIFGLSIYYQSQKMLLISFLWLVMLGVSKFQFNWKSGSRMTVAYNQTSLNERIIDECPSLQTETYKPAPLMYSAFMQMIFANFMKKNLYLKFREEPILDQNGEEFGPGLYWVTQSQKETDADSNQESTLVVVLPGLTGGPDETYIHQICSKILQSGFTPVVYNKRLLSPKIKFEKGKFINLREDFTYSLEYIKRKYPKFKKFYAVAHSYGSHTLINYLALKDNPMITGAVVVASPFDQTITSKFIKGTIYDKILSQMLSSKLSQIKDAYSKVPQEWNVDIQSALKAKSVSEFQDCFTKNIYGYTCLEEYNRDFGCAKNFHLVKTPILTINAKDDPISHYSAVPISKTQSMDNYICVITEKGGHLGWIESFLTINTWYTKPAVEYLNSLWTIQNQ